MLFIHAEVYLIMDSNRYPQEFATADVEICNPSSPFLWVSGYLIS